MRAISIAGAANTAIACRKDDYVYVNVRGGKLTAITTARSKRPSIGIRVVSVAVRWPLG